MTYLDCGSSYSRTVEFGRPETLRLEDRSVFISAAIDGGNEGYSSPPMTTPASGLTTFIYRRSFFRSLFNSVMTCLIPVGTPDGPRRRSRFVTVVPSPTTT